MRFLEDSCLLEDSSVILDNNKFGGRTVSRAVVGPLSGKPLPLLLLPATLSHVQKRGMSIMSFQVKSFCRRMS